MSVTELKLSIFELLTNTKNNSILTVVYDILHAGDKQSGFKLSVSQEKELERRIESHKKGKSKSYSWEEVKRSVRSGK